MGLSRPGCLCCTPGATDRAGFRFSGMVAHCGSRNCRPAFWLRGCGGSGLEPKPDQLDLHLVRDHRRMGLVFGCWRRRVRPSSDQGTMAADQWLVRADFRSRSMSTDRPLIAKFRSSEDHRLAPVRRSPVHHWPGAVGTVGLASTQSLVGSAFHALLPFARQAGPGSRPG